MNMSRIVTTESPSAVAHPADPQILLSDQEILPHVDPRRTPKPLFRYSVPRARTCRETLKVRASEPSHSKSQLQRRNEVANNQEYCSRTGLE